VAPDHQPTQPPSGIVTPEAVVLEFETAGVGSRGVAKFLDLLVMFAALIALLLLVTIGAGAGAGSTIAVVLLLLGVFLIVVGYPVIIEILWHGKTLGKAAFGLRVITREGAPIKFRHAAVRGIIGLIEVFALPFIAVLSCASSRTNQRFGDMAGGTIVIRERKAASKTGAVTFPPPPGLEEYVRALDVAAVTSEQYQVIRSFLLRVFDLTPAARMALAVRLANPVAIELKHDPPPMVNPELFLACVASAYQLRHGGPAASWQLGGGAYSGYAGYGAYGPAPVPAGAPVPGGGYVGGGYEGGGAGNGYSAGGYAAAGAPGAGYPGAPHPGAAHAGASYPGASYPGASYPGAGQPGSAAAPGGAADGAGGTWYPGIPPRTDGGPDASGSFTPTGPNGAVDPYATADESRPLPPPPRPADPWAPVASPPTTPDR
jgi:uncharacterized RDD family membrane protein YckC